jgi:hypothetical protein
MSILHEPVIVRLCQFLLQEAAIDVTSRATKFRTEDGLGIAVGAVQKLHVVQNVLGITLIKPIAATQFIEVVELLSWIPSNQFNA